MMPGVEQPEFVVIPFALFVAENNDIDLAAEE
jgi:hypothetical protein